MKTDVLVVSVVVICAVKHGTVAPLQTPDKIQWMYDQKTVQVREVAGSMTVHALVNDGLHVVCLCVPAILLELLY